MIVQACLNGARPADFHPALPHTAEALARDARACAVVGAAELHVHPRAPDGRESLEPAVMDKAVRAIRDACPGTMVGVSTGAWIENDVAKTRNFIAGWCELPDYASVNLSEEDAPAVIRLLEQIGVGVEAGLASVADTERLLELELQRPVHRILIEISETEWEHAQQVADDIAAVLAGAGLRRPILLHGFDGTVWPFVKLAAERRWSTRVGLEDGRKLPDSTTASGNAELVTAAVDIFRQVS